MAKISKIHGEPETITISYKEYVHYLKLKNLEELAMTKKGASKPGTTLPEEVDRRLKSGASPIKAWRMYRDMTQAALAIKLGVNCSYISLIESGSRKATIDALYAIASELEIPLEALTDPDYGKR